MTVLIPFYTHSLALLFSPSNLMEPNDQFTYPFNSLYKSKFLKRENKIEKKKEKSLE